MRRHVRTKRRGIYSQGVRHDRARQLSHWHRSGRLGGALYLVLWIYGLLIDQSSDANFVPLSDANNWLHLFLGVGMIGLGMVAKKALDRRDTTV